MSNDTDFKLKFSCPTREQLEHVLWYLDLKKRPWDYWSRNDNGSDALLTRVGMRSAAAVVSWGFSLEEEIQVSSSGRASIQATAWANQNTRNVYISGSNGEIADLRERFSFLTVDGTYTDEYDNSGPV